MVNLGQTVVIFHRQQLTDSQKLLPNGEKLPPDGEKPPPNGQKLLPNGEKLPPDGINFYLMLKTTAGNKSHAADGFIVTFLNF